MRYHPEFCLFISCFTLVKYVSEMMTTIYVFKHLIHFKRSSPQGHHQSPDLLDRQEDWRQVQDQAEVYKARPDCNCQVGISFLAISGDLESKNLFADLCQIIQFAWRLSRIIHSLVVSRYETKVSD